MQDRIEFDASTSRLADMHVFVNGFAERVGLSPDERSRLVVIIEELVTNVDKYGYPDGAASKPVSVTLQLDGDRLVVEFSDQGRVFDPSRYRAPKLEAPLEERPEGLLGLHIVQRLADEMSYQRVAGCNIVRVTRYIRPCGSC